jgi:hypothetical protein
MGNRDVMAKKKVFNMQQGSNVITFRLHPKYETERIILQEIEHQSRENQIDVRHFFVNAALQSMGKSSEQFVRSDDIVTVDMLKDLISDRPIDDTTINQIISRIENRVTDILQDFISHITSSVISDVQTGVIQIDEQHPDNQSEYERKLYESMRERQKMKYSDD